MTFKKLTTKLLAGVLALSTIAGLASCSILEQVQCVVLLLH